jgi:hypothetical protein
MTDADDDPTTDARRDSPGHVFDVEGDIAVPTDLALGPWAHQSLHGSPAAALLARCLLRHDAGAATFPVRFTLDLIRPVPASELRVRCATVRSGRKLQLVEGSLLAGDTEVCKATLLRFREAAVDAAPAAGVHRIDTMARPAEVAAFDAMRPPWATGTGFWDAIDAIRTPPRGDPPGPRGLWLRLRVPIVAGEEVTPLERMVVAADFGNALGAAFEPGRYACINADLTVNVHRLPAGEWVGVESSVFPEVNGIGVSESVLSDERGRVGLGVQHALIDEIAR